MRGSCRPVAHQQRLDVGLELAPSRPRADAVDELGQVELALGRARRARVAGHHRVVLHGVAQEERHPDRDLQGVPLRVGEA